MHWFEFVLIWSRYNIKEKVSRLDVSFPFELELLILVFCLLM